MANAAELSFRTVEAPAAGDHLAERSGGDDSVCRGVPDARRAVHLRSRSAVRAHVRGELREGIVGAKIVICNDYEFELIRQKREMGEDEVLRRCRGADRDAGRRVARSIHARREHGRDGRAALPDRGSDWSRRCVSRRVDEGPGHRRVVSGSAPSSGAWRPRTRWSTLAVRATPTRWRSSRRGTRSTSARRLRCRSTVERFPALRVSMVTSTRCRS